jgi:hypothetical protein
MRVKGTNSASSEAVPSLSIVATLRQALLYKPATFLCAVGRFA